MVEPQMMAHRWLIGRTLGISVAALTAMVITTGVSRAAVNASGFEGSDQLGTAPGALGTGTELGTPGTPGSPATDKGAAAKDNIPASANPLWAIPLGSLSTTRERPLFTPSRKPPAPPPVVSTAPPPEPAKPVYVPPPEPEKPQLSLVGVVTGVSGGFAVFLNNTTRDIIRLKLGEGNDGWVLRSVKAREAVLEKNHQTAVIGLPASEDILK
jgi:general secretion pathway protein N